MGKGTIVIASICAAVLCGCGTPLPDVTTGLAPEVLAIAADGITDQSATLSAQLSDGSRIDSGRFSFQSEDGSDSRTVPAEISGNAMSATVDDLLPACTYTFFAIIENGHGQQQTSATSRLQTLAAEIPDNPDNPDNPDIPSDPGIMFTDPEFQAWILWHYDADKDGILSEEEARKVDDIHVNTDKIATLADLSQLPNLRYIDAGGTRTGDTGLGLLTEIDVHANDALDVLYAPHNRISSLKLPAYTHRINRIELCINELETMDLHGYDNLNLIDFSWNRLTVADISGLDRLDEVHLNNNPLGSVTLNNKLLRYIDLHGTNVAVLDFSLCPTLNEVDCTDCPNLKEIILAKGQTLGILRTDPSVKITHNDR